MSESMSTSTSVHDVAEPMQSTAGEILKSAREAAGIHIEALAVALKVPVGKLEALESNRLELLPDTVFLRALASSVCRTLKLDPAPVLLLLPQSKSPRLVPERPDLNAPVKTSATGKTFSPSRGSQHSSWLMWGGALLLVGAAALFYWPSDLQLGRIMSVMKPSESALTQSADTVQPAVAEKLVPKPLVVEEVQAQPNAPSLGVATAPSAQFASSVSAPASVPVVQSASMANAPAEDTAIPLLLRVRADSWVQVKDASGRVIFEKKLVAGDSAPVSGSLPFNVVVGRADVTDVFVRGKAFELTTVSRENVARFEVKQ